MQASVVAEVASVAVAPGLGSTGSVAVMHRLPAPWHMGSSQTRDTILLRPMSLTLAGGFLTIEPAGKPTP